MSLAFRIARRMTWRQARPLTRLSTALAVLSIALGVAVMLISTSISHGFEDEVQLRISSLVGDVEIQSIGSDTSSWYLDVHDPKMFAILKQLPEVEIVVPVLMRDAILKSDSTLEGVQLKGLGAQWNKAYFQKHLSAGQLPDFATENYSRELLISKRLASRLQVAANDSVRLYFWERQRVRVRKMRISGVFDTGLYEFDAQMALCDRRLIERIQGEDTGYATSVEVYLRRGSSAEALADTLHNRLPYNQEARAASERFSELYNWLSLQHQNVLFILIVMTLVAVLNMSTALIITIIERTAMVGLLRALGGRLGWVLQIFIWRAALMIGLGIVLGNGLAFLLLLLQESTGLVRLDPESYFLTEAPVRWVWSAFGIINGLVLVVCTICMLLPALIVRRIRPIVALRLE